MKKLIIFIFCFGMLACTSDDGAKNLTKAEKRIQDWQSIGKRYERLNRFSGTVIIANGQNVIFKEHYGKADFEKNLPITNTTSFKVGAATEIFTAHIILGLVYQNMISLRDKLNKYLPEIKADYTIDEVLNHTAGLPSTRQLKQELGGLPKGHIVMANQATLTGGDKRNISDIGYNLLGLLIEKVTKASLDEAIDFQLKNQQLENTYYAKDPNELAVGYTGFVNYRGKGLEPQKAQAYDLENAFSSTGVKSTAMDLLKMTEPLKELDRYGYLENDGFSFGISKDKVTAQTIIVLSNIRHPVAKDMIDAYKLAAQGEEFQLPLLRERVALDVSKLQDFTGTYAVTDKVSFKIEIHDEDLVVNMGTQKTKLIPQSENQFFMEEMDAALRFLIREDGQVIGVEMLDGFINGKKVVKID